VAVDSFTVCSAESDQSSDCQDVNMAEVNKAPWTAQVACIVCHSVTIFNDGCFAQCCICSGSLPVYCVITAY